jgi:S-adenosylmethionine hydrolase
MALYHLQEQTYVPFGGKSIYPKAIGKILGDPKADGLGQLVGFERLHRLDIASGTVVHIDNFGLIKIFGPIALFANIKPCDHVQVFLNGKKSVIAIYEPRIGNAEDGTWLVYPGSSLGGMPELGLVRGNAALALNVNVGDNIMFSRID